MSTNFNLEVVFEGNDEATYYPGQTVKGHIELSVTTQPLKLRGLSILIKGSAACSYSTDLQAEQEFFVNDQEVDLETVKDVKVKTDSIELPVGNYQFEFNHRLPRNLPYSVDGQYGNVKYFVQAKLDIPWDLYDRKVVKPFTVLRYEDLNYMSGMREGREVSIQKTIDSSAWFFSKSSLGLITIKANIPKCGFAPGEKINVDVSIDNQTSADIENVLISLQCNENYAAQTPWAKLEEKVSTKISETIAEGIKAGFTKKIKESVLVPETSKITSVMFTTVFQISYHVQITAKFKRATIPISIPIYIGSVALKPEEECGTTEGIPPLWPPEQNENGAVKKDVAVASE